jgi:hypothetical protein
MDLDTILNERLPSRAPSHSLSDQQTVSTRIEEVTRQITSRSPVRNNSPESHSSTPRIILPRLKENALLQGSNPHLFAPYLDHLHNNILSNSGSYDAKQSNLKDSPKQFNARLQHENANEGSVFSHNSTMTPNSDMANLMI